MECRSIKGLIWSATALLFCIFTATSSIRPYYWALQPIDETAFDESSDLPFDERKAAVITRLEAYSASAQSEPLRLLNRLAEDGSVENIRPLWICNIIRFDADEHVIAQIDKTGMDGYIRASIPKEALLFDPRERPSVEIPGDSISWSVERIGAPSIWLDYGLDGSGVLVALLDSGVDFGNINLDGALWRNPGGEIPFNGIDDDGNGYIDDWRGYDWPEDDPWPHDEHGHGTHVAGTIAGRGIMGMATGVAPGCEVLPLKVLNDSGMGEEADVWEAIQYAIEAGARVMNLSIGWRYGPDTDRATWRAAVDAACAAGVVMSIAGGNEGGTYGAPDNLRTPGDVPRALTVGASTITNELASFSSVGPVSWSAVDGYGDYPYPPGLIKPDIVAPGDSVPSSTLGGGLAYWDGTSMACPHVSGAAALLVQFAPDITHDSVKTILESSAIDLGPVGKDSLFGSGLLDLNAVFGLFDEIGYIAGRTEPDAVISCEPSGANVLSDSTGNYLISIPAGSYSIEADKFGFDPNSALVIVAAGDTTFIDLPLSPGVPISMKFTVRDFATGDQIDSAWIVFEDWPSETLFTDMFGMLTTIVAESDPTVVRATKPGFISDLDSINVVYPDTNLHRLYLHKAMDFEVDSMLSHWGTSESGDDDWEWGEPSDGPTARSGRKLWATRLDTSYSNSTDSWLRLGEIDLTGEAESPIAVVHHWFELEATSSGCWDGGNMKASIDGSVWEIVEPEDGYPISLDDFNEFTGGEPGFSGEFGGMFWREVRFPLDEFIGDTVEIALHIGSDNNTVFRGWFIDDVALLPATFRAPIFRWANAVFDEGVVAVSGTLYEVSAPVDSIIARFFGAADGCIDLDFDDGYFHGEIPGPYIDDTLFIWLSAKDIAGRRALFPEGAPDSVLSVFVEIAPVDSLPPTIRRWAYWPSRLAGIDSARFRFIVNDESPFSAEMYFSHGPVEDTLAPPSISSDTLAFASPIISFDDVDWRIRVVDTFGNVAVDSGTIDFSTSITLDFASSPGPVEPLDSSGWRWALDTGWVFAGIGSTLAQLPIPLWECPGTTVIEIDGRYDFSGDAAGVLLLDGETADSIAAFPDTVSPGNPFFPGLSGITGSGSAATAIIAPSISPTVFTLTPTAAISADSAYWRISSISFTPSMSVREKHIPLAPSLSVEPNPFNGSCLISVANPASRISALQIFDISGRLVWKSDVEPGQSTIAWNGNGFRGEMLPSGIYLIRIEHFAEVFKAIYLR